MTVGRTGSSWHAGPCPCCHAPKRHQRSHDKRGALGFTPNRNGFRCFVCDASGTGRTLARLADNDNAARDVPAAPPPEPPRYLPAGEAEAFWGRCLPVAFDDQVSAWLAGLRIDTSSCVRALPSGTLPTWAGGGVTWARTGHRAVFALYDHNGVMRSLLARAVVPADVKSLGAAQYQRKGLVMACPVGVAALRGQWRGRVVVVEGEKKLAISTHLSRGRWASIGTGSGMWSVDVAKRLARAGEVCVYSDCDPAGERYAQTIYASLAGMVTLRREFAVSFDAVSLRSGAYIADDDLHVAGGAPGYAH